MTEIKTKVKAIIKSVSVILLGAAVLVLYGWIAYLIEPNGVPELLMIFGLITALAVWFGMDLYKHFNKPKKEKL